MAGKNSDKELQKKRRAELQTWFQGILPALNESNSDTEIQALSGDASFRHYFISRTDEHTYVLVDAPPDKEDSRTFVQVAEMLQAAGINVPKIHQVNYEQGFMCLSFLGDTPLWEKLDALNRNHHLVEINSIYQNAFRILLKIQGIKEGSDILLPLFDGTMLLAEMDLFREWFCEGIMDLELSASDNEMLDQLFDTLIESALSQPQVFVHRDYHSRNLMYQADGNLGVLDFQDAVIGPVTYDLVSLIKDCYIIWPKTLIRKWALQYANLAQTGGIINEFQGEEFLLCLDMMGLQRHLKAIGIFSRLYLRDGKTAYLADIPRTLDYIKEVLSDYPELYSMGKWFEEKIYPMAVTRLNTVLKRDTSL